MMKCTRHYDYIFAALMAPFTGKDEVKTLPKAGKPKYVTARTVMNRLDEVLGPQNWWDEYTTGGENSVLCRLTIRLPDGSTLTKCDAGGFAGMADHGDDDKSGYSDAFKRAALKFGVARYIRNDGVPDLSTVIPVDTTPQAADRPPADTGSGILPGDAGRSQPTTTPGPAPVEAPWKEEPGTQVPEAPSQVQASEAPGQEQAESKPQGLDGTDPFKSQRTFWNDILDEVNRANSAWMADHPDSEEVITTSMVVHKLVFIAWDAGYHPIDPSAKVGPDGKPMSDSRWAAVLNKVSRISPEINQYMADCMKDFVTTTLQNARKLEKKNSRGGR
jgi:hypothetical protein